MSWPTLQDVKDYYGYHTSDYNDQLTQIITWTSALIEKYLGREFSEMEYSQEAYKLNSDLMHLANYPVSELLTITIDGVEADVSEYHLDKNIGSVYGDFTTGAVYVVTYTGGYATLPQVVEDAFYGIVNDRFEDYKDRIGVATDLDAKDVTLFDFAKVSFDTGGTGSSISYQGVGSGNVPASLANYLGMLDMYKSDVVVLSVSGVS